MYNNCAETHLGGGVMSAFVFLLATIAQVFSSTFIASKAREKARKDSDHTVVIAVVY